MRAPPTASSATCCTSGEHPALGALGGLGFCPRPSDRILLVLPVIWMLTWFTLSSPRFRSSRSGRLSLHGDIRLLFSRRSLELDTGLPYELQAVTEAPHNPRYSPLP